MRTRWVRNITVAAFAGALGLAGTATAKPWDHERPIAPSREGMPPLGVIRSDVNIRVAHDGRADTGGAEARQRMEPRARTSRPDSNLGQERSFALPIKSEVALRAEAAGKSVSSPANQQRAYTTDQSREVKVYPGRHEHAPPALPIKRDIMMQVTGGEAGMGEGNANSDDPKLSRDQNKNNNQVHRDTRVYPGRHEKIPSAVEASMWMHKRESAQGDSAGDKDAP